MIVRFVIRCLIGGFLVLSPQFASAQAPAATVAAFQANPSQLLSQFPNGGAEMANQIRDLLAADRTTLPTIITLARIANEDQRKAMAGALAQFAKSIAPNDPAFSNQIQQAVARSGLPEFAKAYADAAGDTGTASTGGGGGGGGGPTTPLPTGGPNTGGIPGNSSAVTTGFGLIGPPGLGNPNCTNCSVSSF